MQKIRKPQAKYTPEFKLSVIIDMRENNLGYHETVRKYNLGNPETGGARKMLHNWERIYLEEGAAGLYVERRGRATKMDNPKKGRPRKKPLKKEVENDLIAENQRLKEQLEYAQMEIEYLKKLDALVRAEAQQNGKKRK
jgi:transposase-like protein